MRTIWRSLLPGLLVVGVMMGSAPAYADGRDPWAEWIRPSFAHLDQDQGVPSDTVFSLAQDRQGYIWIGTTNGLARYDGRQTRVFGLSSNPAAGSGESLPDAIVRVLYPDPNADILWVGTHAGGLARLDLHTLAFKPVFLGTSSPAVGTILAVEGDGAGGVWVATYGGIAHVAADGHGLALEQHGADDDGSLPANTVFALHRDRRGGLWVGTQRGLALRDPASGHYQLVQASGDQPMSDTAAFLAERFWTIAEDDSGTLWLGSDHHGLALFVPDAQHPARGRLRPVLPAAGQPAVTTTVRGWAQVRPGVFWLPTLGDGLMEVDAATATYHLITRDVGQPRSLATDVLRTILRDRSGLLWLGGDAGVDIQNPQKSGAATVATGNLSRNSPLPLPLDALSTVKSLTVARDGGLWLGGEGRLLRLDGHTGTIQDVKLGTEVPSHQGVVALADMGATGVLVGTTGGLYRLMPPPAGRGAHIEPGSGITPMPLPAPLQAASYISDLVAAPDGGAWIGTFSGLAHLRPDGQLEAVADGTGLINDYITSLAVADDGTLYIGTQKGLLRRDPKTGAVVRFTRQTGARAPLASDYIVSLAVDGQRRLWVGTMSGGIAVMTSGPDAQPGTEEFRRIDQSDGLPHPRVNCLTYDGAGGMWAATFAGVVRVDTASFQVRTLDRNDNVSLHRYWENASALLPDGRLLFGGDGGFTLVAPRQLADWSYQPPVVVTHVMIDDRDQPGVTAAGDRVVIHPGQRTLEVWFAALDYATPERNRFSVRLAGYETEWSTVHTGQNSATYANLPPGHYTLEIRGTNSAGVWSPDVTRLTVRVLPAWYQTWWAKLLGVVALLLGILGFVQARTRALRQRQSVLEAEVERRTEQLRSVQQQLVQQEKLASLGELVAGVAHEINTPLGIALTAASQLNGERLRLADDFATRKLKREMMEDFLARMAEGLSLVLQNLNRAAELVRSFKRVAADRSTNLLQSIDLGDYLADVAHSLRPLLLSGGPQLIQELPTGVTLTTEPGALAQVVTNLVQNALIHAFPEGWEPRTIHLRLSADADHATIILADSGAGMTPEVRTRAFDPFFTTKRGQGGTGLGLHIVHNLVTGTLGGKITLDSQPGSGTTFTIILPRTDRGHDH